MMSLITFKHVVVDFIHILVLLTVWPQAVAGSTRPVPSSLTIKDSFSTSARSSFNVALPSFFETLIGHFPVVLNLGPPLLVIL